MKIEEKTVYKYVVDGVEFDSYDDAYYFMRELLK